MPKITYSNLNQSFESRDPEDTILDISVDHRIPHLHECGGSGLCTTCRVRILDGLSNLTPLSSKERIISRERGWDSSIRLACQVRPTGDVSLQRLIWSTAEISHLQLETIHEDYGEEKSIAILFCDLRNFTSITSKNLVFDMVHMLNRFYTLLGDPILINNGIIYQYVGDEIVGIFGASGEPGSRSCTDAIRAALGMQYAVSRLNRFELSEMDAQFDVGIGLHFGRAYLGKLGHPKHKQFAVVGDAINVTSRIQGETKNVESKILISQEFLDRLPPDLLQLGRAVDTNLRGKTEETTLHEVVKFAQPDISLEVQATLDLLLKNEDRFASRFYDKVFEIAPETRALFKNNLKDQGRLLTHMLSGIVYSLSRPSHLKMGLRTLGKNHTKYGVEAFHYPVVKQAILETIQEELGEEYNEDIGHAWEQAMDMIIDLMKEGQAQTDRAE